MVHYGFTGYLRLPASMILKEFLFTAVLYKLNVES